MIFGFHTISANQSVLDVLHLVTSFIIISFVATEVNAHPNFSPSISTFDNLYCQLQHQFPFYLIFGTKIGLCNRDHSSTNNHSKGWDPSSSKFPLAYRSNDDTVYQSVEQGQISVKDPYRWLEKSSATSNQTREWVNSQVAFTKNLLDSCQHRSELQKRLEVNFNYSRYSIPTRVRSAKADHDDYYYYTYNSGLNAQPIIYQVTDKELVEAEKDHYRKVPGRAWFNQNLLSSNGTVAIASSTYSNSGKLLAYGISQSGSDWVTIYFRETSKPFITPDPDKESAKCGGPDRLKDVIEYTKFAPPAWTPDDVGVFYMHFPPFSKTAFDNSGQVEDGGVVNADKRAELYYHKLGTSQDRDILVIKQDQKNSTSIWYPTVSADGKWLLVVHKVDTDFKARTYLAPLNQPIGLDLSWICLSPRFEYRLNYLVNKGNDFYFVTNKNAPNDKVVRVRVDLLMAKRVSHVTDLEEEASFEDVIKEGDPIGAITVVNEDRLLMAYSRDVKDELWQFHLETGERLRRLLPDFVGSIDNIGGRVVDDIAYVSAVNFANPGIVTRLTWPSNSEAGAEPNTTLHRTTKVEGIVSSLYETKEVFVTSKDGTKIPVFLTYQKDTKLDGSAPAWMFFYGSFGQSLRPEFSVPLMTWITAYEGVLVWINARGGGEYGEDWHDDGRIFNKQHTFDDVLETAEYLVLEKIAAKGKIIVNGESSGGLAAMAVGNQASEGLLGGIVAEVGVHDMLRFMHFTAGNYWSSEYGNPESDPNVFDYIFKYSPLHNVNASKIYPTTLLTTADHDDRVPPLHSFKMTAELQYHLPNNPNPILVRVETDAGHHAGKSTEKFVRESVEKFCITAMSLGLELKALPKPETFINSEAQVHLL